MNDQASEIPKEWNHPGFNEKGKIICQVCGKTYMILTPSHLKTHDMSYSQYKTKFPGAPLTNEEFKAMSMYSRPSKYSEEDLKILGEEQEIDEDIPVIDDEFELPKVESTKKFDNPMDAKKHEILDFLINYLPNVKMDHMIELKDLGGTHVYSTISDFSDPFLKINIEFPNTFWHNRDAVHNDPARDVKLKGFGWKVININSNSPKIEQIEKAIRKIL